MFVVTAESDSAPAHLVNPNYALSGPDAYNEATGGTQKLDQAVMELLKFKS